MSFDDERGPFLDDEDGYSVHGDQRPPGVKRQRRRGLLRTLAGRADDDRVVTTDGPSLLDELGISKAKIFAVVALVAAAGLIFLIRFGGDPQRVTDSIRSRFGLAPEPISVQFERATSATTFTARYQGQEVRVRLVGLRPPHRQCPAALGGMRLINQRLAGSRALKLEFTPLGSTDEAGTYLALVRGGQLNRELLQRGWATLTADEAREAKVLAPLKKAAGSAVAAKRGQWSC